MKARLWTAGLVLASLLAAQSVLLLEDIDFGGWTTALLFPTSAQASGERQAAGGNPGAHYLVTHVHDPDSGRIEVLSESRAAAEFRVTLASGEQLEFGLEHAEEEEPAPLFLPTDVYWAPIVVQGDRVFRSQDGLSSTVVGSFRGEIVRVSPTRFRALDGRSPLQPDFSAQAPPIQVGVDLQTNRVGAGTVRVRLDNLRVRRVGGSSGGPDLWVSKSDGLDYLCDEHELDDCGLLLPPSYRILYGNRGRQPATGVVLTDTLPLHFGRVEAPWQCRERDGQGPVCSLAAGRLEPGASREIDLAPIIRDYAVAEGHGYSNLVSIDDDGTHGPDQNAADNLDGDDTAAILCADDLSGRTFCCAIRWLAWTRRPGDALPDARRSLASGLAAFTGHIFETARDLDLFYRIRDEVFRRTPGGRQAIELYDAHTTEITRLLAADSALRDQALATLTLWKPNLQALADGQGGGTQVTAAQLGALESFLDALEEDASADLRQVVRRQRQAIGLDAFVGLTLDQGLRRLDQLACTASPTTLCLQGGRFRVEASYLTAQASGLGRAVALTADTGYFWFFTPANVETMVKVLDGCGFNQGHWVFAAGLTNVRVVTTVTDTRTGAVRTYTNPLGRSFQPVQDTNAFACP